MPAVIKDSALNTVTHNMGGSGVMMNQQALTTSTLRATGIQPTIDCLRFFWVAWCCYHPCGIRRIVNIHAVTWAFIRIYWILFRIMTCRGKLRWLVRFPTCTTKHWTNRFKSFCCFQGQVSKAGLLGLQCSFTVLHLENLCFVICLF